MTKTMDLATWSRMTPEEKDYHRDLSGLIPELVAAEGWRIEVTRPDGTVERYYVGRSLGWRPCHIAVKTRRSHGGMEVYWPPGTTYRKLYKKWGWL
jgi:hypothetical protein